MDVMKPKNFDSSFLYGKGNYQTQLFEFVIKSHRVDKTSESFDDIRYMVKKNQYTSCLVSLLDNPNIILMISTVPMSRAFKVFSSKDVKEDGKPKVFVDVSDIIGFKDGVYSLKNRDINILLSYLVAALGTWIYYADPSKLINNTTMYSAGTNAFAKLACNVIDYMRIGGVENVRPKVLYLAAMYYQVNLLRKDPSSTVKQKALKISGLTQREAELIDIQAPASSYDTVETFVNAIAKVIRVETLKIDNFIDKWIFLYGSGTQFATELYFEFSNMLTHAYVGAYINNQKQIEKFVGRDMVDFTNALFRIGSGLMA